MLKLNPILKSMAFHLEEASSVFADPLAAIFYDEEHSIDEHREIIIGVSENQKLLIVSFTEREENIRIISARIATPKERRDYESNPQG